MDLLDPESYLSGGQTFLSSSSLSWACLLDFDSYLLSVLLALLKFFSSSSLFPFPLVFLLACMMLRGNVKMNNLPWLRHTDAHQDPLAFEGQMDSCESLFLCQRNCTGHSGWHLDQCSEMGNFFH